MNLLMYNFFMDFETAELVKTRRRDVSMFLAVSSEDIHRILGQHRISGAFLHLEISDGELRKLSRSYPQTRFFLIDRPESQDPSLEQVRFVSEDDALEELKLILQNLHDTRSMI